MNNNYKNDKIDFVITWVDGSDPKWLKEKIKYEKQAGFTNDSRAIRYRDFDLLKYWFRAVETNAPWVHKIYFVTWGHIPKWLNTDNEKLVIVKHSDFIPKQYLPTFNSCAIEMNLHRIKGLSENFVYFNDDMYVLNKTKPTDFFKHGLPCDTAIADAITPTGKDDFHHTYVNNSSVINRHFTIKQAIKKHPFKWFNIKYGARQIFTLFMLSKKSFSVIKSFHMPSSLVKSSFTYLWKNEYSAMDKTCSKKFRSIDGVNPWLVQNLQIANGSFAPRTPKIGKLIALKDNTTEVKKLISLGKNKLICLNDSSEIQDFQKVKNDIRNSFEKRFPNKSSYEV